MINDIKDKKIIELQIQRLENSLLDIKLKTENNPLMFNILANPYVKQIRELRQQIEEFIGVPQEVPLTDLIVRISGEHIGKGRAPISVVASTLKNVRSAISNTYASLIGVTDFNNLPKHITEACDFSLLGTAEGSIQLILQSPSKEVSLLGEEELSKVFEIIYQAAEWAIEERPKEELEEILPNKEGFNNVLKNLLKLTPPKEDDRVDSIHLYGQLMKKDIILTNKTREYISNYLYNDQQEEKVIEIKGTIREIDLDKKSFILRDIMNLHDVKEVRCKMVNSLKEDVFPILNSKVIISGIETSKTKSKLTVSVLKYTSE